MAARQTTGIAYGSPASIGAPRIYPTQAPLDGATKYYDLTIPAATATSYTLQAAPIAGSA
jgi:type IV pilus assembly protein PilE